jgi:hypothetical protein
VEEQDLEEDDPERAVEVLTAAFGRLDDAEAANVPSRTVEPLRADVVEILDRLYGVVPIRSTALVTFESAEAQFDLVDLVAGPDGAPYVLDDGTQSVYRIQPEERVATLVVRTDRNVAGEVAAAPAFLTSGGPDLVIVDERNQVWRWRPADATGEGTLNRMPVRGASSWGEDVLDIGTFLRNAEQGLYNLYVIDPSEQQILAYPPAADRSGFPADPTSWLAADRDVDSMRSLLIDGDIYVIEGGVVERFVSGRNDGWSLDELEDGLLREAPRYTQIASASDRRQGRIYAFDARNRRLVAFEKETGAYIEQYRLAGGDPAWVEMRSFYVVRGVDSEPDRIIWIGKNTVNEAVLDAVRDVPAPTPRPTPSPDPSALPEESIAPASAGPAADS